MGKSAFGKSTHAVGDILTDSGGIQEEKKYFRCFVTRVRDLKIDGA